jgi:hypothetical protein
MPAQADIQYAATSGFILSALEYWIPACAGMTASEIFS